MIYVLDANAMIALLRKEPGGDVVVHHLAEPDATAYAHAINLCEVYYAFHREESEAHAFHRLLLLMVIVPASRSFHRMYHLHLQ